MRMPVLVQQLRFEQDIPASVLCTGDEEVSALTFPSGYRRSQPGPESASERLVAFKPAIHDDDRTIDICPTRSHI